MQGCVFNARRKGCEEDAKPRFGVQALACTEYHSLKAVLQTQDTENPDGDLVAAISMKRCAKV